MPLPDNVGRSKAKAQEPGADGTAKFLKLSLASELPFNAENKLQSCPNVEHANTRPKTHLHEALLKTVRRTVCSVGIT